MGYYGFYWQFNRETFLTVHTVFILGCKYWGDQSVKKKKKKKHCRTVPIVKKNTVALLHSPAIEK